MRVLYLFQAFMVTVVATTQYNNLYEIVAATPACALKCSLPSINGLKCTPATVKQYADCVCENQDARRKMLACAKDNCSYADVILAGKPQKAVCEPYPFPSRKRELINASIVLLSVTIPFMLLRLWSRGVVLRVLWWDDALLAVASVFLIAFLALIVPLAQQGLGRHSWDIEDSAFPALAKMSMSCQVFYNLIQQLCKLSILVCFLRIFPQKHFRIAVILTCVFIIMKSTAYLLITIWKCTPINAQWNFYVPGKCIDGALYLYIGGIIGIVEDIWILIMPLPMLRTLRIPRGQKVGVAAMLGVGSLACVTSMLRLKQLSDFGSPVDPAWDNTSTSLWSMIECSVAVICASLPALRPLLSRLSPRLFGTMSANQKGKSATSSGSKILSKLGGGSGGGGGTVITGNGGEDVKMYNVLAKTRGVNGNGNSNSGANGTRRAGEEENTSRECFDLESGEKRIKSGIMVQQDFEIQSRIEKETGVGKGWRGRFT